MNELVQILKNTRQHLMTGVSHMIPFVVSGGILLAVSVMLYGKGAVPDAVADPNLKKLFDIGVAGLTLMVPFLAAYIGYSIAERSALGDAYLHYSYRRHTDYRRHHDVGLGRACRGVDQQPDSVASGDAAGQHCYAGGDHGSDAGVRYGRSG
ncbi:fructose-like specific PTS system EIIC component 2 [Escherichia coli]|nr:fructose-like specific PTS system EIIC component 2 [Escherichia coli]